MRLNFIPLMCIVLILTACQDTEGSSTGGGGAGDPLALSSPAPVARQMPTSPPSRKGTTIRSSSVRVETAQPTRPQTAPAASETEEPSPAFTVCSPLVDTPLEELSQIVSDPYRPPPPGSEARHHGVDFAYFRRYGRAAIEGAGIQSVLNGQVAASIVDSFPYGNMLIIETPGSLLPPELADRISISAGESLYTLYAHMERPPKLRLGDSLKACQPLGNVGKSGNAGGAHLHLEARLGPAGTRFSGMAYYKVWATDEQRDNYLLWRTSGIYRHFDPMTLLTGVPK
ncbi:MAG: hypothetical protein A2Z16_15725 [Chloroflexi bacterium RBG_16_54_18]|nr:MAG: hypothetical protein A2Z16_15725 [Chloroflexi bacterium RBG_16_54_18]